LWRAMTLRIVQYREKERSKNDDDGSKYTVAARAASEANNAVGGGIQYLDLDIDTKSSKGSTPSSECRDLN
jgi:hypothetical protein